MAISPPTDDERERRRKLYLEKEELRRRREEQVRAQARLHAPDLCSAVQCTATTTEGQQICRICV